MGIRIIKTAIATIIAIYLALYFNLENALSAGVFAILGLEATRMRGFKKTAVRFIASVLGLFFASFIFIWCGFNYWAVALFVLIVFPVLARFQLNDGIVTCCVIVFHLFGNGQVTPTFLINEISLLFIGLGTSIIINMFFMPKDDQKIINLRIEIEHNYNKIFQNLAMTLRNPNHIWSGEQLLIADKLIAHGKVVAVRNKENRFWDKEAYWITYFEMRSQQYFTITKMMEMVALVHGKVEQSERLAEVLEQLGEDTQSDVYKGEVKERLAILTANFREMSLPKTREEFETRASLLMLMYEIDSYLEIAKKLKRRQTEKVKIVSRT